MLFLNWRLTVRQMIGRSLNAKKCAYVLLLFVLSLPIRTWERTYPPMQSRMYKVNTSAAMGSLKRL